MNRIRRFALEHVLAVPIGVVIALVRANVRAESYFKLSLALSLVVNNLGMALFFALVPQEVIEAMVPGGALHTWRHAMRDIRSVSTGKIRGSTHEAQVRCIESPDIGKHERNVRAAHPEPGGHRGGILLDRHGWNPTASRIGV
jgi:hypothetical protein